MKSWMKVLNELGSGTLMLRGYVSATQGLRLLGTQPRTPGPGRAAPRLAGTDVDERGHARGPRACN